MTNTTKILGNEPAVQVDSFTLIDDIEYQNSQGFYVGSFRRGRMDKLIAITPENISSTLGYDPLNKHYQNLLDLFNEGVKTVNVLRILDNKTYPPFLKKLTKVVSDNNVLNYIEWEKGDFKFIDIYLSEEEIDINELNNPYFSHVEQNNGFIELKNSGQYNILIVGYVDDDIYIGQINKVDLYGYLNKPIITNEVNLETEWDNVLKITHSGKNDVFNFYLSDTVFNADTKPDIYKTSTNKWIDFSVLEDGTYYLCVGSKVGDEEILSDVIQVDLKGVVNGSLNLGFEKISREEWRIQWSNLGDFDYNNVYISEVPIDKNNLPEPSYQTENFYVNHSFLELIDYYIMIGVVIDGVEILTTPKLYSPLVGVNPPKNITWSHDLILDKFSISWEFDGVVDSYKLYISKTEFTQNSLPDPIVLSSETNLYECEVEENGVIYFAVASSYGEFIELSQIEAVTIKRLNLVVDIDFRDGYKNKVNNEIWSVNGTPQIIHDGNEYALKSNGVSGIYTDIDLGVNFTISFKCKFFEAQESGYNVPFMEYGNGEGGNDAGSDGFLGCVFGQRLVFRTTYRYFVDQWGVNQNTVYYCSIVCIDGVADFYINNAHVGQITLASRSRVFRFGYGNINWYLSRNFYLYALKIKTT